MKPTKSHDASLEAIIQRAQNELRPLEEQLEALDERTYDQARDQLEKLEDDAREFTRFVDPSKQEGAASTLVSMERRTQRLQRTLRNLDQPDLLEPVRHHVERLEDWLREELRRPSTYIALLVKYEAFEHIIEFEASTSIEQAIDKAATSFELASSEGLGVFVEGANNALDSIGTLRGTGLVSGAQLTLGATPPFNIVVNGRPKRIDEACLSWREIVELAYPNAQHGERIEYTVVYDRGPRANPEGTLVEGQSVTLKQGMVFNVDRTDKS